jgi:uncharacterized protein (TIGR02145 family)
MLFRKVVLSVTLLFVIGLIGVQAQTVTDIDGNVYNTVTIGTQVWMAENLRTTKFNDGTVIPLVTDVAAWVALTTPGYCWYNNDPIPSNITYGLLYNFYVQYASYQTKNVCPTGYHLPEMSEWSTMENYLGTSNAGGKLKEAGTVHWQSPNTGATNETGFTALPGGYRTYNGSFTQLNKAGYWWASSEGFTTVDRVISIYFDGGGIGKTYGCCSPSPAAESIRCVRDLLITDISNPSTLIIETYPNPVSGILTIDYKGESFETVNILNSQGIFFTKEKAITPSQQLDFSKFEPGLYILEFAKATGEIKRVKIVKR